MGSWRFQRPGRDRGGGRLRVEHAASEAIGLRGTPTGDLAQGRRIARRIDGLPENWNAVIASMGGERLRIGKKSPADILLGSPPRTRCCQGMGTDKVDSGGPIRAFPRDEIVENGRLIGTLVEKVRRRPRQGGPFRSMKTGRSTWSRPHFYMGWRLASGGIAVAPSARIGARGLSVIWSWLGVILAWLMRAATTPWTSGHLLPVIEYAPFCVIFFLVAFRSALQNYQIRTRRLATASEYLQTPDSFWPK